MKGFVEYVSRFRLKLHILCNLVFKDLQAEKSLNCYLWRSNVTDVIVLSPL